VLSDEVLHDLDLFGHLMSLTIVQELGQYRTLQAAVATARDITHHRDNETGGHLDRMSRYARLIAETLAPRHGFSDEYVERIFLFSPLHDIGKIAIPDEILLKPGQLNEQEYEIMKSHAVKGREIIDSMLVHFGIDTLDHSDILRNITQYHHETLDGLGYPEGLQGKAIPIEARIIAVADIFDALTSRRPYKGAWDNEQAFALLKEMAGTTLDGDCVSALLDHRVRVEQIQQRFREDPFG
jgi:HD-GYP domain-containing protein (c-di-GMP phosphodiesterase class II)